MRTRFMALALATACITSTSALAGPDASCHFHGNKPIAEAVIVQCATQHKDKLVASGKLERNWQTVSKAESVEQVAGQHGKEWKLRFKNAAAADKSKDALYFFYTLQGNLIAANHTGQ